MTKLSNTLKNVNDELKNVKSIEEINNSLTIRNEYLEKQIKYKNCEIEDLKNDKLRLSFELTEWKNKFLKIIKFIKNRLLRPKDKDRYEEFTIDLYNNYVIDDETYNDIVNNKNKRKDDFER